MKKAGIPLLAMMIALAPHVPMAQEESADPVSIVPPDSQKGVYTTHTKRLPWEEGKGLPPPALLKLDSEGDTKPGAKPAPAAANGKQKWLTTVPFGKASSDVSQPVPTGPRAATAVPVQDVDAIEVTEPAAASTAPLEADPASENPEVPTEETSPMFTSQRIAAPSKVKFRALNKVTGRGELLEAKPGETVHFGKLEIRPVTCQTSAPNSQLDYAGLFELNEYVPGEKMPKQLFRGWMYATSPSITSLEHPVYDVTMVECVGDQPPRGAAKKDEKDKKDGASEEATEVLD